MKRTAFFLSNLLCVLTFVTPLAAQAPNDDATKRLHALFAEEWEYDLRANPVMASSLGDRRYNDRWPDASLAAIEKRHAHDEDVLKRLAAIDAGALSPGDQLNYSLFERRYRDRIEGYPFRGYLMPQPARRHPDGKRAG